MRLLELTAHVPTAARFGKQNDQPVAHVTAPGANTIGQHRHDEGTARVATDPEGHQLSLVHYQDGATPTTPTATIAATTTTRQ